MTSDELEFIIPHSITHHWIVRPRVETEIMRRFERCVPGSNPGEGTGERPCGGTETTRACEARNPGSIPGGGNGKKDEGRGMKDETDHGSCGRVTSASSFRLHPSFGREANTGLSHAFAKRGRLNRR